MLWALASKIARIQVDILNLPYWRISHVAQIFNTWLVCLDGQILIRRQGLARFHNFTLFDGRTVIDPIKRLSLLLNSPKFGEIQWILWSSNVVVAVLVPQRISEQRIGRGCLVLKLCLTPGLAPSGILFLVFRSRFVGWNFLTLVLSRWGAILVRLLDRVAILTVILVLYMFKSVFTFRLLFNLLNQLLGSLFVEFLHLVFCLNILLHLAQVRL